MAEKIHKYHPRAPRYILRPQDKNVMRFSLHEGNISTVQQTVLLNLSETGVAFVTSSAQRFEMGDMIMVEIPIPGGEQIAWWAQVIRIEVFEPNRRWGKRNDFFNEQRLLIGARFEKLPEGHSRALRRGIDRSLLKAMRDQRFRTLIYYKTFFIEYFFQMVVYAILCALAFGLMYYWTRPDINYDPNRPRGWGERIKF